MRRKLECYFYVFKGIGGNIGKLVATIVTFFFSRRDVIKMYVHNLCVKKICTNGKRNFNKDIFRNVIQMFYST